MKNFAGKLAVITGGGTGMGRELALQLVAARCDVAFCDVISENMAETVSLCQAEAPQGIKVTSHFCDVSNEDDVKRFRDEVVEQHQRDHINLLFNNAGVGGGGTPSFIDGDRDEWERTFNICWYGVYYTSRAFMQLLVASDEGHLINTSSVNGFWASIGPTDARSSYATAKFAVKGLTEALVTDFRMNAPHVGVSLVMPGHIGTPIQINSSRVMGKEALPGAEDFQSNAPTTAAEAATIILNGVRENRWRILVGPDAELMDVMVREMPEDAYDAVFIERLMETIG